MAYDAGGILIAGVSMTTAKSIHLDCFVRTRSGRRLSFTFQTTVPEQLENGDFRCHLICYRIFGDFKCPCTYETAEGSLALAAATLRACLRSRASTLEDAEGQRIEPPHPCDYDPTYICFDDLPPEEQAEIDQELETFFDDLDREWEETRPQREKKPEE